MEVQRAPPLFHFSALILSRPCTHPIQLSSVIGLLYRVRVCTHFSRRTRPSAATAWDPTSSTLCLPVYLSSSTYASLYFFCLAVFHGVMIPPFVSSWLSSSFGKTGERRSWPKGGASCPSGIWTLREFKCQAPLWGARVYKVRGSLAEINSPLLRGCLVCLLTVESLV